jgi:hypothetical protein
MFKKSFAVAIITILFDFLFHFFLTNPMESITYFVIKFLLAFFVATGLFSLNTFTQKEKRKYLILLAGLIFSTLMSVYYRVWELGEAYVPFGSRAPDIIGIDRGNLFLFSGTWWLGHALFFILGVLATTKIFKK